MRIEQSNITMCSNHSLEKSHTRTEFFKFLHQPVNSRIHNIRKSKFQSLVDEIVDKQLNLRPDRADELQKRQRIINNHTIAFSIRRHDPLRELIEKLLNLLMELGLEINCQEYRGSVQLSLQEPANLSIDFNQFEFERRDVYRETESLRFGAVGTVETADHRKIVFDTQFELGERPPDRTYGEL